MQTESTSIRIQQVEQRFDLAKALETAVIDEETYQQYSEKI